MHILCVFSAAVVPKKSVRCLTNDLQKSNTYVLDFARHPWRANQAAQKLRFSAACYSKKTIETLSALRCLSTCSVLPLRCLSTCLIPKNENGRHRTRTLHSNFNHASPHLIVESSPSLPETIVADVVIAGAGAIGLFVAQYLVRKGISVAVVEAGDVTASTRADGLGAASVGKPHAGVQIGRAFGLGGTSTLWGGQLVEFEPDDLVREGSPWPIDWLELKALYRDVYAELGLPVRASDAQWQRKLGTHFDSSALDLFYTSWLPQPNFSVLWGSLIREHPKLCVYLDQTAMQTYFEGEHCVAIEARNSQGRLTRFAGKQILLALGTVGNAQFCLTQQLHAATPWAKQADVGAWFHDHLFANMGELQILDKVRFRTWFENCFAGGHKLQPKLRLSTRSSPHQLGVCGFFGFRSTRVDEAKHLLRTLRSGVHHAKVLRLPMELFKLGATLWPLAVRYLASRRVLASVDDGVDFLVQAEQLPTRESAIRAMSNRRAENGLLDVVVDWQLSGFEAPAIRHFCQQIDMFLTASGTARMKASKLLSQDDQSMLAAMTDTYHQCGGLRMSATPDQGITNADGRIWSTNNVYVLGASVLPSSSYANSTLTALAMSLKAARAVAGALL
jgi:choline dehydrogenase-like flavoprotein